MYYLAVDVGNTETLAVVFMESGQVLGIGKTGSGNFQDVGRKLARQNIIRSIKIALKDSGINFNHIKYSYLGVPGADRERDYSIVEAILRGVVPGESYSFDNDAVLGLLAEVGEKRGVCVICGSGTNVIGFGNEGRRVQIGGLGYLFGDYAGGAFMTQLAIRRAVRGWEGRGPETVLYEKLCQSFSLEKLIDLIDQIYEGYVPDYGARTPLIFEAAREGDQVACDLIKDVAVDLALSVRAALNKLDVNQKLPVIALGGVFQKPKPPILFQHFEKKLKEIYPHCNISLLSDEPVLGAAAGVLNETGNEMTPEFKKTFRKSFQKKYDHTAESE